MTYSKTVPYSGGGTLYAKPVTDGSLPSSTPTWATDVVATASSNSSGVTFTGLTDGQSYWVFTQAGGSPASTDLVYATFRDDRGDVRAAVGLATANLDTQLTAITSATTDIATEVGEILPAPTVSEVVAGVEASQLGINAATAATQAATAATQSTAAAASAATAASSAETAATQATIAAAEVVKIPRAASALTAGGFRWTKDSATASLLDVTISETP